MTSYCYDVFIAAMKAVQASQFRLNMCDSEKGELLQKSVFNIRVFEWCMKNSLHNKCKYRVNAERN